MEPAADEIICPECGERSRAKQVQGEVFCRTCAALVGKVPKAKVIPFGKFRGWTVQQMQTQAQRDYLRWMLTKIQRLDFALRLAALQQLNFL